MLDTSDFLQRQHVSTTDFYKACDNLNKRVDSTIKRMCDIIIDENLDSEYMHIGHSGGKDSVVITNLALTICSDLPLLHNPKPDITTKETIEFLYGLNMPTLYIPPDLEDQSMKLETQIDGTRRYEFDRTNGKSTDFIWNGKSTPRSELPLFVKNGLYGRNYIYPIFDWTDAEVWAYLLTKNLPFSKEYLL